VKFTVDCVFVRLEPLNHRCGVSDECAVTEPRESLIAHRFEVPAGGIPVHDVFGVHPLLSDTPFEGPAIVEQSDTTTVVYPRQICRIDELQNLLIATMHADDGR